MHLDAVPTCGTALTPNCWEDIRYGGPVFLPTRPRYGADGQRPRRERETRGMTATIGPCISADSHITEPPGTYIDRIDPAYRDRAPRLHHHDALGDVMLIDNGKSLVPFWLVAAAGRPTEEVRLDSHKRFDELWRGG